jgi:hypothetical protein
MSIHKVTNVFVSNLPALEADVNTLTPGTLGLFNYEQEQLSEAYAEGNPTNETTPAFQASLTYADGSFKKSMWVNGRSVITAAAEKYAPAQREVWSIGYNRATGAGSIAVNPASLYSFYIKFKNDKSFYSERPERFTANFTSSSTATQLSIATQAANLINNGAYKTQIKAVVVGDGTGAYGLTGATNYGVEITALDINQFQSSTYKENRVYFDVFVDDSSAFEDTTTCSQILANSFGTGTYNSIYNKENFEYQYEGLSNRRLWPAQQVKFGVSATPALSSNVTGTTGNVTVVLGSDLATVATSTAIIRAGELIDINGVAYEVKYVKSATQFVLTVPATASASGANFKFKYFYNVINVLFDDVSFTTGADVVAKSRKAIVFALPAIDGGGAYNSTGSLFTTVAGKLVDFLETTPAKPNLSLV